MEPSEKILALFVKKKWTLSLTESCTGGSVAHALVAVAGASDYFLGGVVAYSNEAKKEILDVKSIEKFGAVSVEVALEMGLGALKKFHSTHALAITGIAGPTGGTLQKPVGTVCFSLVTKTSQKSWEKLFAGDRHAVMELAKEEALRALMEF